MNSLVPESELLRLRHFILRHFIEKVAATGYDGRPCSHGDCGLDEDEDECPGEWSVSGDEEHDSLVDLVSEARQLLGLPDLYS